MAVSPAVLIAEAVHLATEADVERLRQIVGSNSETLHKVLTLRILLTYLPESCDPDSYAGFVDDLIQGNLSDLDHEGTPLRHEAQLEEKEARERAKTIQLLPLDSTGSRDEDILLGFLIARAHRIEYETGSLLLVQQLVGRFADRSLKLDLWIATTLLPLLRLEYEYHPQDEPIYSLSTFEALRDGAGLEELLSTLSTRKESKRDHEWANDIRCLVAPWIYGEIQRRRHTDVNTEGGHVAGEGPMAHELAINELWLQLFRWILDLSSRSQAAAANIIQQWHGPDDLDLGGWLKSPLHQPTSATKRYRQTALALIYLPRGGSDKLSWATCATIIERCAVLGQIEPPPDFRTTALRSLSSAGLVEHVKTISPAHVLPDELLQPQNPLTDPEEVTIYLAFAILASNFLLDALGESFTNDGLSSMTLFGFQADQRTTMRKILRRLSSGSNQSNLFWRETREKMLWLRDWGLNKVESADSRHGVFCKVSSSEMELEILKALATAGRFNLVNDLYITPSFPQGPSVEQIEKALLDVAYASYDNASNGNKTRGGMKKTSDIITTFRAHFSDSRDFSQAQALVQATHALSFYSLILHHGVPFLPVNIRVHTNPLSLIEKVLSQNQRSYTKLDDLLEIGRNLVRAGLIKRVDEKGETHGQEHDVLQMTVERKVVAQAIHAALKEDDFDTAYSYVVNRLSSNEDISQGGSTASSDGDDILWQAAYEAGRYRTKDAGTPTELRRLEQRMELLSKALLLAPPSSLQEVLATWRECENEVNTVLAQESFEEERWNNRADRHLPGGFTGDDVVPTPHQPRNATRRAMDEEAPMGLFDVARGAASAFSRSAFPLRGPGLTRAVAPAEGDRQSHDTTSLESGDRVRKRDMVSSMVTGGLASSIGWVIGAPASAPEHE